PEETGETFYENARGKARFARSVVLAEVPVLGEDSGLEVDALDGAPGPASARYGGPGLSDAERVTYLLRAVGDAPARTARFRCVLALIAPWGEETMVEGLVEGILTDTPRGIGGFGYDPVFLVPEIGRTLAELTPVEKHRVSHRGRAVGLARPILARWARRAVQFP
ncbi:MAG: non-canonical purine NTP pyrophosphatase, partial [Candidatus Rokuibacteriota bacterium]